MHRPALVVLLIATSWPFATALPARAAATCWENTLTCECLGSGSPVASTAPGQSCAGEWKAGDPCDGACYDLRLGLLQVTANRSLSCANEVGAQDEYRLVGAPDGLFYAELHVTGTLTGSATAWAALAQDPMNWGYGEYTSADSPVDERIVITAFHVPGEPFGLGLGLHAALGATPGMAELTATLEFLEVPEGGTITSCQGYTMPVPTLPSTWARVKATYR